MRIEKLNKEKEIPLTSIEKIVAYLYDDELKHYQEWHDIETEEFEVTDREHIFYHINKVNQWLKSQRRIK